MYLHLKKVDTHPRSKMTRKGEKKIFKKEKTKQKKKFVEKKDLILDNPLRVKHGDEKT